MLDDKVADFTISPWSAHTIECDRPITIVTLGLFLIVLNALLFWFAGSVLKGFQVNGFWWAVIGALLYSLMSGLLSRIIT